MDERKTIISREHPDILFFNQVIPKGQRNPIHEPLVNIAGYELYSNFTFTDENLGASGKRVVVIYVKDTIKSEEIFLGVDYDDQIWVEIKLKGQDVLLCGCIYRSPTKEKHSTIATTKKVCEIISKATKRERSHLVICGDFNFPDIDWENEFIKESTAVITPFIETIHDCHLYQHVTTPTRYRYDQEPSLLDLVFTNEENVLQDLHHVTGLGGSDHECLTFNVSCNADQHDLSSPSKNFHKGDYKTIRQRLQNVDWEAKFAGDFKKIYAAFVEEVEEAMEGCIPNRINRKKQKSLYLTPEALRKKDLLWRKYKATPSTYTYQNFIRARNDLRALSRKLRRDFENKIARDIKSSPKQFWAYVKSRTKSRSGIPALKKADGKVAKEPLEKAEALNNFFSSVFTSIFSDRNVHTDHTSSINDLLILPDMVLEKLLQLKPDKTPGPDGWHPLLLKNIADIISASLSIIFQKSLNEGLHPSDWLKACVTYSQERSKEFAR